MIVSFYQFKQFSTLCLLPNWINISSVMGVRLKRIKTFFQCSCTIQIFGYPDPNICSGLPDADRKSLLSEIMVCVFLVEWSEEPYIYFFATFCRHLLKTYTSQSAHIELILANTYSMLASHSPFEILTFCSVFHDNFAFQECTGDP